MTDILCFSTTDWDEIWGSRQQIMSRLAAAGHRVLFIERQVGLEHLVRNQGLLARRWRVRKRPALRAIQQNLWLWQPPLLPPGRYYSTKINQIGQDILGTRLRPVLDELAFTKPLLWVYPPHSAPLIGKFSEQLVIYHCIERFIGGQSGRKRRIMQIQETNLLRRANRVFVHSEKLQHEYQVFTRYPITLVPSAADVAHFQSTDAIHPEVACLPQPRLGVSGTLDNRIDVDLLKNLAYSHPEWHLVLIGQVRSKRIHIKHLHSLPNLHLLGRRQFEDLPAMLNGMDVLLIPYVRNELTEYISPIKLYEYLAIGKPIVSTDLPGVRPLSPWVSLASDQPGFARAVQDALNQDTPQMFFERRRAAQEHTWEARIDLMWAVLNEALSEKKHVAH
jgi:glycosyltransferase involved in cell wall biosynthesis